VGIDPKKEKAMTKVFDFKELISVNADGTPDERFNSRPLASRLAMAGGAVIFRVFKELFREDLSKEETEAVLREFSDVFGSTVEAVAAEVTSNAFEAISNGGAAFNVPNNEEELKSRLAIATMEAFAAKAYAGMKFANVMVKMSGDDKGLYAKIVDENDPAAKIVVESERKKAETKRAIWEAEQRAANGRKPN
jgi:hypothetical protein